MLHIDHGSWVAYKPTQIPEHAPAGALFARRESDGVDWYDYVNSGENFDERNVKFMALWQDSFGSYVVGPAVYDPTMLFPAGQIVVEVDGYTGIDPQKDFGGKLYDPETHTLTDPPPPPEVESIEDRVARLVAVEVERQLKRLKK